MSHRFPLVPFVRSRSLTLRASSMSLDSHRLHSRRERSLSFACVRLFSNVRDLGLRLIDSNFPVLGLRPPLCCVYVAPLPAGSIRSLPLAQSPRRPSSMSLDSHRLHSRRERLPGRNSISGPKIRSESEQRRPDCSLT